MTMIYRRNRGLSPTLRDVESGDGEPRDDDASFLGGARRWWSWRRRSARSSSSDLDASSSSLAPHIISGVVGGNAAAPLRSGRRFGGSHRVVQIMWLAVLLYSFLGLPVLGRVLNFVRYVHRFTVTSMLKGLVVGLFQDVAIFFQASTLICVVKLLFNERNSLLSMGGACTGSAMSAWGGAHHDRWLRSDAGLPNGGGMGGGSSNRFVRLPVYMPVLNTDYDVSDDSTSTIDGFGKHTTVLASSAVAGPTSTYFSSMAPRGTWLWMKVRRGLQTFVVVLLIKVILVFATIASVVDFCLQVTMHPRLNRAFVEIFVNYAAQFTASLSDEEVLTRTVVCSWTVYFGLISALTYGFYAGKLPLLPHFLPGFLSWFTCDRRYAQRKDSMQSSTIASSANSSAPACSYMASLFPSYWLNKKAPQRMRRRSGQNHTLYHHPSNPPSLSTYVFGCGGRPSAPSSFSAWSKPNPLVLVLKCVVASLAMTLFALTASLLVDGKGVDMKLMSNAMFSLQTENFFVKNKQIAREEINCTLASQDLLATQVAPNELYQTVGLGNDDHCALLWRKTVGYTGETFFNIQLKNVTVEVEVEEHKEVATLARANATGSQIASSRDTAFESTNDTTVSATTASTAPVTVEERVTKKKTVTKVSQPNIIVINMESWRALDVGVLGAAAKLEKFGKSVTPEFDALSKTGVLYKKHYTQCVQTTRTLLTQLFGMLPSCTETTALKHYGTSLNVRGLPQFLKKRGYFNMFWSAVDLTWEYWDKFLAQNGFDKLVDDRKVRKMLHEVRNYKNQEDDHFSWGMHDHLSFEMLLHAIEASHNATQAAADAAFLKTKNATATDLLHSDDATGSTVEQQHVPIIANASTTSLHAPPLAKTATRTDSNVKSNMDKAVSESSTHTTSKGTKKVLPGWEGLQEPYFIDMYSITSHNPWALPNFYEVPDLSNLYTRFNKKYLDSMYFSDEMLGKFIRDLREKGLMKNTIVVIQGDHGYGRMEHDNNPSIADSGVYDEVTHVPFLILADDFLSENEKGMQVNQLTMQGDLMATVADILGVSEEEPLYQHGYGHSMKRRRPRPDLVVENVESATDNDDPAILPPLFAAPSKERQVLLCNPFDGMTKGVRTEELKYIFYADGAFKVFELESDPMEKHPVRAGFDVEKMDPDTRAKFDYANEYVELNQFLFEANKFMTPIPTPKPKSKPIASQRVERRPINVDGVHHQITKEDGSLASEKVNIASTTAAVVDTTSK
uniref:Sulfatase N-terminal domain-containing protein n=1 Tax=Globisporangium ultimum (strain ATCC 200006 / CBS 805.95 / DAOM BR144) TaxID=431595 RepID=K3WT98_GLOUD